MGFFGTYLHDGTRWESRDDQLLPAAAGRWLWIDVHDSDLTTVQYRPSGSGTGVAYLGLTPRVYFADDDGSAPTDVAREATGLAQWWASQQPAADGAARSAKRRELTGYLAADDEAVDPDDEDGDEDVEVTTARFLRALDLPVPPDLEE